MQGDGHHGPAGGTGKRSVNPMQYPAVEQDAAPTLLGVQQELISAHLLVLTRLLRRSAQADYEGLQPENWIERRIMLTLLRLHEGSVTGLANSLGNDIAQVSRSLSSLNKRGLLDRKSARAPYRLSPDGRALAENLDRLALQRDRELVQSFGQLEMFELGGMLASLCSRAMDILAEETANSRDGETEVEALRTQGLEFHSRVIPATFGLANYIARGATLAIKRLIGLSQYEWRVLAYIASRPGMSFMELVTSTDSDKAQLSRALDSLTHTGLLARMAPAKGKHASFEITVSGQNLHAVMQRDALRRNGLLLADLGGDQPARLRDYLTRLIARGQAMTEAGRQPYTC